MSPSPQLRSWNRLGEAPFLVAVVLLGCGGLRLVVLLLRARSRGFLVRCSVVWRTTPPSSPLALRSCYHAFEASVAESVVGVGHGSAAGRELMVVARGRPTGATDAPTLSRSKALAVAQVLSL